ncbi:hypothetical protein [Bradyrhizobium canariense]|uniref:Uncharacterized protein n=1 Tax=Bradyrhizobium canariense TaxID=255045 RepID=A0A1H1SWP5_9BRAD|nr:hypothetical protein [Bradyrhizobium canariense]SDS52364.1 hypothetical protein SAMN05444158_2318 [Bradyrhizobium canariense]
MNHSFYSVDRTTHLKIVILALLAAIAIAGISTAARLGAASVESSRITTAGDGRPAMATIRTTGPA